MKIIDEKGRLFGKINLIDLAVILIVLVAVGALAMKLFGNKAVETVTSSQVSVTYEVVCQDAPTHVAEYCEKNIGGQLLSSGKLLNAHITACESYDNGDGTCELYFTIEGTATYSNSAYVMGSQEVRVGKEHLVKTSEIECNGIISNLEANHG